MFLARIVMPFSRSRSFESIARSSSAACAPNEWSGGAWRRRASSCRGRRGRRSRRCAGRSGWRGHGGTSLEERAPRLVGDRQRLAEGRDTAPARLVYLPVLELVDGCVSKGSGPVKAWCTDQESGQSESGLGPPQPDPRRGEKRSLIRERAGADLLIAKGRGQTPSWMSAPGMASSSSRVYCLLRVVEDLVRGRLPRRSCPSP